MTSTTTETEGSRPRRTLPPTSRHQRNTRSSSWITTAFEIINLVSMMLDTVDGEDMESESNESVHDVVFDTRGRNDNAFTYYGRGSSYRINGHQFPRKRTRPAAPLGFDSKVACMFGLFTILLLCNRFAGQRNTSKIVRWLDIPCGFCLRWLNLLFTPSFVTLPLSPRISFTEVLKIAGVFGT
jgi:hypothetical protein